MKQLLLTLTAILGMTVVSFASNIADGSLTIVTSSKIEVTLENEGQKEFIISSVFRAEENSIEMVFESDVRMIQIFNIEGELEMMFPVDSTEVNLGMSLFEEGSYRMGFTVDGISEVQYTKLQVK